MMRSGRKSDLPAVFHSIGLEAFFTGRSLKPALIFIRIFATRKRSYCRKFDMNCGPFRRFAVYSQGTAAAVKQP